MEASPHGLLLKAACSSVLGARSRCYLGFSLQLNREQFPSITGIRRPLGMRPRCACDAWPGAGLLSVPEGGGPEIALMTLVTLS